MNFKEPPSSPLQSGNARLEITGKMVFFLFFCAALVYFGSIWNRPLLAPDETRYALIPREMLVSGNFAVPMLNGLTYYEKPVLGYWLTAGSMQLFGINPFAVRFPSALFTLLTGAVVYLLGSRGANKQLGFTGTILYLTSGLVFAVGTFAVLDPPFVFLTVAATACGYFYYTGTGAKERFFYLALAGCLTGAGILIKGLLSPLLVGMACTIFLLFKREYRKLFYAILPVLFFTILAAAPGALYMHSNAPDFWKEFIMTEHLSRFFSGAGAGDDRSQPFWFYLPVLLGGSMPGLLLLPAGIAAVWKQWKNFFLKDDLMLFCAAVSLPWLLFFTVTSGKLATYILPLYPFLALIAARILFEIPGSRWMPLAGRILQWTCIILGAALVLFTVWHLLPFVPGKLKIFSFPELIPALMGAGIMLLWFNMAAREKDCFPERKFLYFCIGCGAVMLVSSHVSPRKLIRDIDQTSFIRRAVLPQLKPGAIIMADGGCAAAAAWVLNRNVTVYIKPGEFKRGLSRAGLQAVTPEDLKKMLPEAQKNHRQIVILTRSKNRVREMPPGKTVIRTGRLAAVIFEGEKK